MADTTTQRDAYRDKLANIAEVLARLQGDLEHERDQRDDAESANRELQDQVVELTRERSDLLREIAELRDPEQPDPAVTTRYKAYPVTAGRGASVASIVADFRGGRTMAGIARSWQVPVGEIEAAVRWWMKRKPGKRGRKS